MVSSNDAAFIGHMRMVMDPCAAPAVGTVYSGASGVVTRHVSTGLLAGGASDQALSIVYAPSVYRICIANTLTGGVSYTPGYTTSGVPGYAFLNSVSRQSRVIGACLEIHWNGTELNRGGSIAYGVMQLSQYPGGSATTVDQLYGLLPHKTRVTPGSLQIRWNPAEEDESYDRCDAAVDVANNLDRNGLFFAYQGPPGGAFGYTLTTLYEWVPALGQGQPAPPTVRVSQPAAVSRINSVLAKVEHWGDAASTLASGMATASSAVYSGANNVYKVAKGVGRMIEGIGVPLLTM